MHVRNKLCAKGHPRGTTASRGFLFLAASPGRAERSEEGASRRIQWRADPLKGIGGFAAVGGIRPYGCGSSGGSDALSPSVACGDSSLPEGGRAEAAVRTMVSRTCHSGPSGSNRSRAVISSRRKSTGRLSRRVRTRSPSSASASVARKGSPSPVRSQTSLTPNSLQMERMAASGVGRSPDSQRDTVDVANPIRCPSSAPEMPRALRISLIRLLILSPPKAFRYYDDSKKSCSCQENFQKGVDKCALSNYHVAKSKASFAYSNAWRGFMYHEAMIIVNLSGLTIIKISERRRNTAFGKKDPGSCVPLFAPPRAAGSLRSEVGGGAAGMDGGRMRACAPTDQDKGGRHEGISNRGPGAVHGFGEAQGETEVLPAGVDNGHRHRR